jgi:dienelactone hydrolase
MWTMKRRMLGCALLPAAVLVALGGERGGRQVIALPGTAPLDVQGDIAEGMVAGIGRYLDRALLSSVDRRARHWRRNLSSHAAYAASVRPNRDRLRTIIGAVDARRPAAMELDASFEQPALVGEGSGFKAYAVRWPVLPGVDGEGLMLVPEKEPAAGVVALPDCDWPPEALAGLVPGVTPEGQYARRLAEAGVRVLIPTLIDRDHRFSARPGLRPSPAPHREFVYSAAYGLGRHIVGYEVQRVLAAIDWFSGRKDRRFPIGVLGYGEGGLIALYAAALDERIDAVGVSGYFGPRERLWSEPLYRNVWGLLDQFGDAEIASLIAPRPLEIEAARVPAVHVPPLAKGRSPHAPGSIRTHAATEVTGEAERARRLVAGLRPPFSITVTENDSGPPGSTAFLNRFLDGLGTERRVGSGGSRPRYRRPGFDPAGRQWRQFEQLLEHTQALMRAAQERRTEFWARADRSSPESWERTSGWYRDYLWDEIVGRLPPASGPLNPRTRLIFDEPAYRAYEVALDVYPDVMASGILVVPKDLGTGEARPLVMCQHGLEGRARETVDPRSEDGRYMRAFAAQLAQRGFIAYAPQNPYIGNDAFRVLVRKAHPLKQSLYGFIVRQNERVLEWLRGLPFVDRDRIAFYGISYGGKTALRVGVLLPDFAAVVCSGDFNEWVRKTSSTTDGFSYVLHSEYEMYEFNLANTISHAEMSWLIFPRPFMVERGRFDAVGLDEWVAYSTLGPRGTTSCSVSVTGRASSTSSARTPSTGWGPSNSCTGTSGGRYGGGDTGGRRRKRLHHQG